MREFMKQRSKTKRILTDEINGVAAQVNEILNSKQKDRYFEGIAILHSFIEDILKWLVFTQIVWNRSQDTDKSMAPGEVAEIRGYCNQQNLYSLLNLGLSVGLLDYKLFGRLNEIRKERNSLVHQYWLYIHKVKRHIFRKKLEKLAGVANDLVGKFNGLMEEIGVAMDESFLQVSSRRDFVVL